MIVAAIPAPDQRDPPGSGTVRGYSLMAPLGILAGVWLGGRRFAARVTVGPPGARLASLRSSCV